MSEMECNVAMARVGGGASLGTLEVEGRRWSVTRGCSSSCRPSRHRGGARSGFGLFGLFTECVLDWSIRTNEVSVDSVDSVDAVLVALEDEPLAVDPERRGTCPCPTPKDLARVDMACVELLF